VEDRNQHTLGAVEMACEALGVQRLDLLNVSFPGVGFDAEDEVHRKDTASSSSSSISDAEQEVDEETKSFLTTYPTLESLVHSQTISKIGLSEFGSSRLSQLLRGLGFSPDATTTTTATPPRVRPSVVQINVRDCCVVPRELIQYSKREGIQLLTHNDSAEVLTQEGLQGVVEESGVLEGFETTSRRKVVPLWVVKYTAVVRDRSVVENKGYVISF